MFTTPLPPLTEWKTLNVSCNVDHGRDEHGNPIPCPDVTATYSTELEVTSRDPWPIAATILSIANLVLLVTLLVRT